MGSHCPRDISTDQDTKCTGVLSFIHILVQSSLPATSEKEHWYSRGHRTTHGFSPNHPIGLDPSHVPLILRLKQRSCFFYKWYPRKDFGDSVRAFTPNLPSETLLPLSPSPQISTWSMSPTSLHPVSPQLRRQKFVILLPCSQARNSHTIV